LRLKPAGALEYGSGHLSENSMSLSLASLSLANAGAVRTAPARGQVVAAGGYYFGYWFSHWRA